MYKLKWCYNVHFKSIRKVHTDDKDSCIMKINKLSVFIIQRAYHVMNVHYTPEQNFSIEQRRDFAGFYLPLYIRYS